MLASVAMLVCSKCQGTGWRYVNHDGGFCPCPIGMTQALVELQDIGLYPRDVWHRDGFLQIRVDSHRIPRFPDGGPRW